MSSMNAYNKYYKKIHIPNNNREVFFLSILLGFAVMSRILPFMVISIITVVLFIVIVGVDFYLYINKSARDENKNVKVIEFSWGFVNEKRSYMDFRNTYDYLRNKDFSFYKKYLLINLDKVAIIVLVFGDILVAIKNLSWSDSGIYIAMSAFTKFVFMSYLFMMQTYEKVLIEDKNTEENVLDVFYSQFNSLLSFFAVLFIFFFILSKYIVDIFFGSNYLPFHPSLPFILLANISLVVVLCIYQTAIKLDKKTTETISKFFATFFAILFVFMPVNYIDTVTYFVVGSSTLLSIFLYNFVIKKPEYIKNTYNHLF